MNILQFTKETGLEITSDVQIMPSFSWVITGRWGAGIYTFNRTQTRTFMSLIIRIHQDLAVLMSIPLSVKVRQQVKPNEIILYKYNLNYLSTYNYRCNKFSPVISTRSLFGHGKAKRDQTLWSSCSWVVYFLLRPPLLLSWYSFPESQVQWQVWRTRYCVFSCR